MLPTSEQYQYITDGKQERSAALEKDQRIYAKPINLDGEISSSALEKLHYILAPLYEKQLALLKSGRIGDAKKIEAEISLLLKEKAPETLKDILPPNADKQERDAHKIVSYVLATALVNYVNKDIYDGYAHVRDKSGEVVLQELKPYEKTFKEYLSYYLNRFADGSLTEEEKQLVSRKKEENIRLERQYEKNKNDDIIRKNFRNPKSRKKVQSEALRKGRPLTEKEVKIMKLKAADGKVK